MSLSAQTEVKVYEKFDEFESRLSTESDTTFIVNFWATWCKPCVAELPYFLELEEDMKAEKIKLILVSLDLKRQIESKLIPFIQEKKISTEVVLLNDGKVNDWIDRVSPDWEGSIPATLIFNKSYSEFYEHEFESKEELVNIINPFINE